MIQPGFVKTIYLLIEIVKDGMIFPTLDDVETHNGYDLDNLAGIIGTYREGIECYRLATDLKVRLLPTTNDLL